MYGLEKKQGEKFAFDLEKEIQEKPSRAKEIQEKAEKRVLEIKKLLREGQDEKHFEQFGILLHGYTALQKVVKKVAK